MTLGLHWFQFKGSATIGVKNHGKDKVKGMTYFELYLKEVYLYFVYMYIIIWKN